MDCTKWGFLMQPMNRYGMTPGDRHSFIVDWLNGLFIYIYQERIGFLLDQAVVFFDGSQILSDLVGLDSPGR